MGFIETIKEWMSSGYISTFSTVIFGIGMFILECVTNKLKKKIFDRDNELVTLRIENESLRKELEKSNAIAADTKEMCSVMLNMMHLAYSSSKLDVDTKIHLQKLYDSCSCHTDNSDKLVEVIETEATEEQVEKVNAVTAPSSADLISQKFNK